MMLPPDGAHLDQGRSRRYRGAGDPLVRATCAAMRALPRSSLRPDPAWTAGGTSVTVEPAVGDADRAVDGAQHVGVVRRDHAGAADYDRVGERANTAAAQPASW